MTTHFAGCPCPTCEPSTGVWWALGSVGALSALSVWGSRRGSSNLSDEEHTVLFSLEAAIVDSGDPQATRLFYPTDEEWKSVQSLISKGLAKEKKWPGGHYFVGFGLGQQQDDELRTRCCGAYDTFWDDLHVCRMCHAPHPQMVPASKSIEVALTDRGLRFIEGSVNQVIKSVGSRARYTLGDLAKIQKNMKKADFWLKHDGEPTKTFNKKFIGIKIRRTDVLLPRFLYYMMMHLYNQKVWPTHVVRIEDIRALPVGE